MKYQSKVSKGFVIKIQLIAILILWLATGSIIHAGNNDDDSDGAVYEFRKWDCVLKKDKAYVYGSWQVHILNKRGEEHAWIGFTESPFMKLKKVQARRFGSDGSEELSINKKDFTKSCGFGGYSVYSDDCTYHADLSSKRFPYTVEVEYEKEFKSLLFWRSAVFQKNVPVLRAEYNLTVDGDVPFRYRTIGHDLEPVVSTVKGKQEYKWILDSIPAWESYDHELSWENLPIQLQFCADRFSLGDFAYEGSSWEAIGHWYAELCRDQGLPSDHPVPASEPADARAVLKAIYSDVQETIRYVLISIGVGGWRPHTAESTIKNGYGDCKDMSNLLTSRLRNSGIEAYPALILTRDEGRTDSSFPGFNFNHVITMAVLSGKDTVWLDPTCSNCPISSLRWDDGDVSVLVATDQGGQLRRTPVANYAENRAERISRWTLKADLSADFECELRAVGTYGSRLRNALSGLDADEERRLVERQFRSSGKKYTITEYTIEKVDEIDEPLVIRVSGQSTRPARKLHGAIYCNPLILAALGGIEDTDLEDRPFSLNMYWPETVVDRVTVTWDESLLVDSISLLADDSLTYSFGHLTIASSQYPDSAEISLCKAVYEYTIDTSSFAEFQLYQAAARKIYDSRLKLYVQ